jgi:hypothetical protein
MFRLLWVFSVRVRIFLWRYMPTNVLLAAFRTRRGLKWGVPAMLLATPYFFAAWVCSTWVTDGGPAWLNLLVLLLIWNALKFIVNGPITLVLLLHRRLAERPARNAADPPGYEPWRQMGPLTHSTTS